VCILFGISGFWLKKGILVILDSRVFWSFDEQGYFSHFTKRVIFGVLSGNNYFYQVTSELG
jgi:hypothetical protein